MWSFSMCFFKYFILFVALEPFLLHSEKQIKFKRISEIHLKFYLSFFLVKKNKIKIKDYEEKFLMLIKRCFSHFYIKSKAGKSSKLKKRTS